MTSNFQSLQSFQQLSFSDTGNGASVIFIHGFAENLSVWDDVIAYLSPYYRCIGIQLPQATSNQIPEGQISIEYLADTIADLLKEKHIDTCFIMGHSMGGYIALAILQKYPQLLAGLGLIHSTSYADDEQKKQARKKAINFIEAHGSESFLTISIPDLFAAPNLHQIKIEQQLNSGKQYETAALIQYYESMMSRPDRSEYLRACSIPLLLVCGKFDKAVPLALSLKQATLAKQTHFHILNHSAHMGMYEESQKLQEIIFHYLTDIQTKQS